VQERSQRLQERQRDRNHTGADVLGDGRANLPTFCVRSEGTELNDLSVPVL
jgi:hypothetical protein